VTEQIALAQLRSGYRRVSQRGHFETSHEADALCGNCDDLLEQLPAHRRVVAFALRQFFFAISHEFDRQAAQTDVSWSTLDAAMLEAAAYVADGDALPDAIRITDAVNMIGRAWCDY